MNDFNNCLEFSSNISFADDTNVFIVDNQLQTLYEKELKNIDNWMVANKLSINTDKTNCILFQTPKSQLIKTTNNLHLKLRNDIVEKVSSTSDGIQGPFRTRSWNVRIISEPVLAFLQTLDLYEGTCCW